MGEPVRRSLPGTVAAFAAVVLLIGLPRLVNEDSQRRFEALDQLFGSGNVPTTKYSVIGPLFAAPLWWLGHALGDAERFVSLFNRLLVFAGAAGLWGAMKPCLTSEVAWRFLLILAFASMLPYHLLYFGGEVFTAVGLGVGSALLVVRRSPWGLLLMALGAANTPATIPGMALGMAVLFWHERMLRLALPVVFAVGLVLTENAIRRGHPYAGGYEGEHGSKTLLPFSGLPGFSYPLFLGVLSVLFSFGKGLVYFTPGLFIPLGPVPGAELRRVYQIWIAVVVGLVLVYSPWWAWYGGYFWGPRFFLFACLPASLVLAHRSTRTASLGINLIVFAALALSCWVGANGVVYQQYGDEAYVADGYRLEFALWYVPELSPLWWPFVEAKPLAAADLVRLALFAVGAVYLLAPLAVVIARQLREALLTAWRSLRAGPKVRF